MADVRRQQDLVVGLARDDGLAVGQLPVLELASMQTSYSLVGPDRPAGPP